MSPESAATIGSLCSGYGGLDLAAEAVFGGRTIWHAETAAGPAKILAERWPGVRNFGDISELGWHAPRVDVVTAGYPCQPFSLNGSRKGEADDRHLWPIVAETVRRLRPNYVLLENVTGLWGSVEFSQTWPRCGTWDLGSASELPTSGHRMDASGCSSWLATPTAWIGRRPAHALGDARRWANPDRSRELPDQIAFLLLPTPAASDSGNTPEQHLAKKPGRSQVTSLQILVDHDLISTGGRISQPSTDGQLFSVE